MSTEQDTAPVKAWIPVRLLTLTVVLTIAALGWSGWLIVDLTREHQHAANRLIRIEQLGGLVRHFGEVLGGSVRLAVATGDPRWEARYHRFEPPLETAIEEVKDLAAGSSSKDAAARLDEVNATLVGMEGRAFALVRAGRIDEARAVVFNDEYDAEENHYARAMESVIGAIQSENEEIERRNRRRSFLSLLGALAVIAISLAAWVSIVRNLNRSHVALEQALADRTGAKRALRQAYDDLEMRIAQRTAELAEANRTLHAEVSERKQIEEALRTSNDQFHQLADNLVDVVWVRSADARELRYINPAFEKIWGRSPEGLRADPQRWGDFVFPEDRDRVQRQFASLQGDTQSVDLEYRVVRPSGEIRWVQLRASQVRDAADQVISLIGIITDITERKGVEATRGRLAAILESTTDMVGFATPAGRTLYINPAGRKLLGLTPDEDVTKMSISDYTPDPSTSPTFTVGVPTAMRDGAWSGEMTLLSRSGRQFPASQVIVSHRAPDGSLEYISTIIRDLTEVKRLEAGLFRSQKLETVGRLAGGIAHEFNSIVTAIIGRSEFLLAELPAESPLARHAAEIRVAADRAATLTRRLLAYGGKQALFPVTLDLNRTVQSMESLLHHLLGNSVDVRFVLAPGLYAVRADAGQIEQVIVNLAINARDAMPDGGRLTVETANVTLDEDSTGRDPDLKPGDYVRLAVTDTGTGMSADVKARVFEPFFTTKDVGLGTGLGLSTCYGIIKQSGGQISVYSEPELGTAFKAYLPRDDRPAVDRPAPLASPSLPRGTERILLVEDDLALREMATELLRGLGYVVLAADSGARALKLAEGCGGAAIDLLFTDVVMAEMSGTELADRLHVSRPTTKTLFTSAYTAGGLAHQRKLSSHDALLEKPFTPSALAIKVREVLDHLAA